MLKYVFLLLLLCAGILITSCGSGKKSEKELSGQIKLDGSSTVYPITEAVAEEFRNEAPDVRVSAGSSGSGAGFKKFARGETDISDASRRITQQESQAVHNNNIRFKELTIALDGIAIVVNPKNDWMNTVTAKELKKIWNPNSNVKLWSDIRPDWPKEEIHLFGPNTAHGTYDFFTEAVMDESGASRTDYNAVSDYNVAVQGISTDKYALGYFGLAYFEENKNKLKLVGVDDGSGPVKPSLETVKSNSYTPLSRSLFIYVTEGAAQRPEVQKFIQFYLNNAGELSKEVGYVPLPNEEYQQQKEEFKEFYSSSDSSATSRR